MPKLLTMTLACIVATAAGAALAQPAAPAGAASDSALSTPLAHAPRSHRRDPAEQEARRHALFDRLDADHNGALTYAEFASPRPHAASTGTLPDHARLDANADGTVTREEYAAAMMQRFDGLDANHDGRITPDERPARRGRAAVSAAG